MTKSEAINQLKDWLKNKDGYLEKSASAYNENHNIVFEKTAGAGEDNRCEAWEILKPDYNKSSNPWCAGFVHLAFHQVFGEELSKQLLYINDWKGEEPYTYYSCYGWQTNFENHGARYQSSTAEVGDIIYFTKSHTGIVIDIKDGYIYTCEGNTSGASGVVSNGGGVVYGKKYKSGISSIKCYGRPNWSALDSQDIPTPTPTPTPSGRSIVKKGSSGDDCLFLQKSFNQIGIRDNNGNKLEEDGIAGTKTVQAIKNFQSKYGLDVDGCCGPKTWAKLQEILDNPTPTPTRSRNVIKKGYRDSEVGGTDCYDMQSILKRLGYYNDTLDGICGNNSDNAIRSFQRDNGLDVDGCCGPKTWALLENNPSKKSNKVIVTANSGLRVRKGPSTDYAIITVIEYNSIHYVGTHKDGWYYLDDVGGWSSDQYLKQI